MLRSEENNNNNYNFNRHIKVLFYIQNNRIGLQSPSSFIIIIYMLLNPHVSFEKAECVLFYTLSVNNLKEKR